MPTKPRMSNMELYERGMGAELPKDPMAPTDNRINKRTWINTTEVSQLRYGPVVTYCMVYHYTKRATLARLLANKGLVIYVVYLNRYFLISP